MAINQDAWLAARNKRLGQQSTAPVAAPVLQSRLPAGQVPTITKPKKSLAGFVAGFKNEIRPAVEKLKAGPVEGSGAERRNLAVETVKGLPQAFSTEIGQPTLRGYAGLASMVTGKTVTPSTPFQKDLYGSDKALTAEASGRELVGEKAPRALAVGVGAGIAAADLFGGSGTRASKLYKSIADAADSKQVAKFIDEIAPGIKGTADYKPLVNVLTVEKDPKNVQRIIDAAIKNQPDTRTRIYTPEKPPIPKSDEEVIYYAKTGGDVQYVARDPEMVREFAKDPNDIEVGVVKKGTVKPTGQTTKDQAGIGVINRAQADALYEANRAKAVDIQPPANKKLEAFRAGTPSSQGGYIKNPLAKETPSPKENLPVSSADDTTPGNLKERAFTTGAKTMFPDAADKFEGDYYTRSTQELRDKVNKILDADPAEAERIIQTRTDDVAVATASEYLNRLAKQADEATDAVSKNAFYEKAAEISNTISEKLTELGRGIQAASLLARQTPEGQLRAFSKSIDNYNKTAPPNKQIPRLSGGEAKQLLERARAIGAMTDEVQKAIEWNKFQQELARRFPTPTLQKIQTLWKAGLLTGLKTTGLNLFSNVSHFLLESAKQYPATLADVAFSAVTGKRTVTATQKGVLEGLKEGAIKGSRYFWTGFDERNIGEKLDYKRVNFKNPVFQKYTDTVFQALGTGDQPFYYAAAARSMMDQALAAGKTQGLKGKELADFANNLVKNPTDEMAHYAAIDATTVVFQNKTALGKVAKSVQNIPFVGQFVVPFAQTPSAVATQILNYSPVGAVAEAVKQIKNGKFDQRIMSQAIGRSTVGTIPLYLGYKLGEAGLVKLDYPAGDERSIELDKAEGASYNSIKIGDSWRSPIVLGPAGNLLLMGAYFENSINNAGSPSKAISDAVLGMYESFTEQTFLTGVKSFTEGITDIRNAGPTYINNLIGSFVPTIVSDVARSTDPLERNASASAVSRVMARIPGAREALPPQVNILGQEIERKGTGLQTMLDPTRPSKDVSTNVTRELRRLNEAGYNASPTKLGDKDGYDSLTGRQNNRMWEIAGTVTNSRLNEVMLNPAYQNLPDEQKTELIDKTVRMAQNLARAQVLAEITSGMSQEQATPIIKKHIESGLINESIFKIYLQIR